MTSRTQAWRDREQRGEDPAGWVLWMILIILIVLGAVQLFLMQGLGSHHSTFNPESVVPLTERPVQGLQQRT